MGWFVCSWCFFLHSVTYAHDCQRRWVFLFFLGPACSTSSYPVSHRKAPRSPRFFLDSTQNRSAVKPPQFHGRPIFSQIQETIFWSNDFLSQTLHFYIKCRGGRTFVGPRKSSRSGKVPSPTCRSSAPCTRCDTPAKMFGSYRRNNPIKMAPKIIQMFSHILSFEQKIEVLSKTLIFF